MRKRQKNLAVFYLNNAAPLPPLKLNGLYKHHLYYAPPFPRCLMGFQTLEPLSLYVSGRTEHYIYTITLWVWQDETGMTCPVNYTPRKLQLLWPQAFAICITLS